MKLHRSSPKTKEDNEDQGEEEEEVEEEQAEEQEEEQEEENLDNDGDEEESDEEDYHQDIMSAEEEEKELLSVPVDPYFDGLDESVRDELRKEILQSELVWIDALKQIRDCIDETQARIPKDKFKEYKYFEIEGPFPLLERHNLSLIDVSHFFN